MALGCCSSFKKCSDLGQCIHEADLKYDGPVEFHRCGYKENLDKGLNFYTEYNENNKRRKEEYKTSLLEDLERLKSIDKLTGKEKIRLKRIKKSLEDLNIEITEEVQKVEEVKRTTIHEKTYIETYIQISNRIFLVGERGYGGWSRCLKKEDRDNLASILEEKGITCHDKVIEDLSKNDIGSEEDRCNCRVILTLANKEYNVQNYNVRAIKNDTAIRVASYFINRGLDADIEVLEGFNGHKIIKSMGSTKKVDKLPKQIKQAKPEQVINTEQLSMFNMEKLQYIN